MSEDESQNDDPMDVDVAFYYEMGQEPVLRSQEVELRNSVNARMKNYKEEIEQKRQESNKRMQETLEKALGPCQAHVFVNDDDKIPISFKVDLLEAARICDRTLKHAAYYNDNSNAQNYRTLLSTYLDAYLTDKLLENVSDNPTLRELFCPEEAFREILGKHIYRIKSKYPQIPKEDDIERIADFSAIKAIFDTPDSRFKLTGLQDLLKEKKYIESEMVKFGKKLASAYEKAQQLRATAPGTANFTRRLRF